MCAFVHFILLQVSNAAQESSEGEKKPLPSSVFDVDLWTYLLCELLNLDCQTPLKKAVRKVIDEQTVKVNLQLPQAG